MGLPQNQIVKYYLRKWAYFDQNIRDLDRVEAVKMKILYSALKEMEPADRQFLAEKYRVTGNKPIPDKVMAKRQRIPMQEYRDKRIAIENKLNPLIRRNIALYEEVLSQAIGLEYSR